LSNTRSKAIRIIIHKYLIIHTKHPAVGDKESPTVEVSLYAAKISNVRFKSSSDYLIDCKRR